MAFDAFTQIADIPGEALDEKYNKWIVDGTAGGNVTGGWDRINDKKCS
ncbi:hypothetical protein ALP73_100972 [Pseudomonas coronafaciens pv. garcae]|uniref:Uncharacterized protein n=2 Tax=Pseudomonas syringae group TaxID=136849 RepID=A0AB37QPX2_9PSED|nr:MULTISPECIES: hypothetical protein [Pseudomonas syringae group]KPZ28928.1 hypothetical protein ALO38_100529 [Pseudomonas coronafaciens pv. zizaniae]RMS00316.1 hypothetical protein ALP74_100921 [Pseudomonas coronafaciens pv. garcae]RMS07461.1 hypothetical protein ALP73_100972 [Pseudomonas coronafaciens pv. garcae]RMS25432.1 hypothetical protein ALP71_01235 [Pseudomonas coronafaciens pv. garcae]RMU91924.1 hypothetical protein ALP20_101240 [Pseudomonas coronafaciens pv. coronafaciens]